MLDGIYDWLSDPTGMVTYRSGLKKQEQAQRDELARTQSLMEPLADEYRQTGAQTAADYQPLAILTDEGIQRMQDDYTTQYTPYEFEGTVEDYLDPSIQYQQEAAARGVSSGAAARGSALSGAAQKELAQTTQKIAEQGYGDAFRRMQQERQYGATQADKAYEAAVRNQAQRYAQAQDITNLALKGLSGQQQGRQYGTTGAVTTLSPIYSRTINPTAGKAELAKAEMHGKATGGLLGSVTDFFFG